MKAAKLWISVLGILLLTSARTTIVLAQSTEGNKTLMKQMYDGFNTDDWTNLASIIAADYTEHNPDPGQKPGFQGLKETFAQYRTAFPDYRFTVNHLIAEGDWVCAHYRWTGTNSGSMMGSPATGKPVSVEGYDLVRIADGKMVEHSGVFDYAGMLMQLGKMPMPTMPVDSTQDKKN